VINLVSKAGKSWARIHIASEYDLAKKCLMDFCDSGFCVSLSRCDYIYKYGVESGIVVGLIDYPRFPKTQEEISSIARDIAQKLCVNTNQGIYTVELPTGNEFYSRRDSEG